ncbi:MAG: hypothetical protein J07HX64_00039 [halophilic archaeon J07HX64]|nr:MAG: hypothetical protein J07HX64_00039 [halophilic archaeon J07HX64]
MDNRQADLGAVTGRDGGLVWLTRDATRGVEPVDPGFAPVVHVDVAFAPPGRDTDPVEVQILRVGPGGADDVVCPDGPVVGLDGEVVAERLVDGSHRRLAAVTVVSLDLILEHIEKQPRVDACREPGDVLQVGVASEDRLAGVHHERIQFRAGGVNSPRGQASGLPASMTRFAPTASR